jgi:hypothetical protein
MSQQGTPNALVLRGFDAAGQSVYRLQLSVVEFPKAKHLWDDHEFIPSHLIARPLGDLFVSTGRRSNSTNVTMAPPTATWAGPSTTPTAGSRPRTRPG